MTPSGKNDVPPPDGWARGIDAVAGWLLYTASPGDVVAIDAPLVVANPTGIRECEREVARRSARGPLRCGLSTVSSGVRFSAETTCRMISVGCR
ncbi:MAG: DUF429 domain-containing protein [Microbacteriaceae bacterium]